MNKLVKYGIKVFAITYLVIRYVWNLEVYIGASEEASSSNQLMGA